MHSAIAVPARIAAALTILNRKLCLHVVSSNALLHVGRRKPTDSLTSAAILFFNTSSFFQLISRFRQPARSEPNRNSRMAMVAAHRVSQPDTQCDTSSVVV